MTWEEIQRLIKDLFNLGEQWVDTYEEVKKQLAIARAAGGITDAQWAEADTNLAAAAAKRQADVDALGPQPT